MDKQETITAINYLYERYGVDKSIYSDMIENDIIKATKGIIAELTLKKKEEFEEKDKKLVKDIYGQWC